MDETGLDYPDEDDLDRMLDDELEVNIWIIRGIIN